MSNDVFKIVASVMNVPLEKVNEDSSSNTLEKWDSLRHMNLILAVEEELGVQFSDNDIISIDTVGRLIECIKSKE